MKSFASLLLFTFVTVFFISCKKNNTVTPPVGPMSFKLNGQLQQVMPDSVNVSLVSEERSLQMVGYYNNNKQLSIVIYHAEVGTYAVGPDIFTLSYYDGISTYTATSGTVTITSISTTSVSGTFQFNATNSTGEVVSITDGNFSTPIQVYYN